MSTVPKTIRSAREKAIAANSLICLLQALIGETTTVELRNECYVYGQIIEVDIYMNVSMQNTSYTDRKGTKNLEAFYIRGKNIRYVQIPDHINILKAIKNQIYPKKAKAPRHHKRENRYKVISEALAKQAEKK